CMDSLEQLIRGYQDRAMDLVNLKINRIGGLTRAKQFRDLCVSLGIVMTIEDSWGGEIATAAIAHLAHSTPDNFHFQSSAFHEYHNVAIAEGGPTIEDGKMFMSDKPGLGVEPNYDILGATCFEI
ncbi:MAG: L-alanine-DL-glutamate epimerase-like enolase superfamily enzyme, partial [Parasphingorhabdus sp.]